MAKPIQTPNRHWFKLVVLETTCRFFNSIPRGRKILRGRKNESGKNIFSDNSNSRCRNNIRFNKIRGE